MESIIIEKFPKHHKLIRPGHTCEHVYFVIKGILRGYWMQRRKEVTVCFIRENETATSVAGMFNQAPGKGYVDVVETAELGYIRLDTMWELSRRFPEFGQVVEYFVRRYNRQVLRRFRLTVMRPAKERFQSFLKNYPGLVHRVPLKYVASSLALTPETLSRIKAALPPHTSH
ncbi:Crp/Fnr family transcriptional regulator [Chitinophaga japonensis]|nr:Crp/Fnr family transcriptional regulator [Chitinophaga japonensis]